MEVGVKDSNHCMRKIFNYQSLVQSHYSEHKISLPYYFYFLPSPNFPPVQSTFLFCLVWSLGATCDGNGHEKFDSFLRELMSGKMEGHDIPSEVGKIDVPIPPEGLVYDYMFEVRMKQPLSLGCVQFT